jgi:hypothetical protein
MTGRRIYMTDEERKIYRKEQQDRAHALQLLYKNDKYIHYCGLEFDNAVMAWLHMFQPCESLIFNVILKKPPKKRTN